MPTSKQLLPSEQGATLIEYVLLIALVALVCIASIQFMGTEAKEKFEEVTVPIAGT